MLKAHDELVRNIIARDCEAHIKKLDKIINMPDFYGVIDKNTALGIKEAFERTPTIRWSRFKEGQDQ